MTTYVSTGDPQGWRDMTAAARRIAKAPSKVSADHIRNVLRYFAEDTHPSTVRLGDMVSGTIHDNADGCALLADRLGCPVTVVSYDLNDVTVRIGDGETIRFERVGYLGESYGPLVANMVGMLRYLPEMFGDWFAYRNLGDLTVDRANGTVGLRGFRICS